MIKKLFDRFFTPRILWTAKLISSMDDRCWDMGYYTDYETLANRMEHYKNSPYVVRVYAITDKNLIRIILNEKKRVF